jgi:tetratricopeptide (TPR) repeat protein
MLTEGKAAAALDLLKPLHFAQVPSLQRWRLAALRGQCYFERRQFVQAQEDLIYATQEEPELHSLSSEQRQEMVILHLRLAGTYRALNQLDNAQFQFEKTLELVNRDTPFGYVAEAQWGISLIEVAQASVILKESLHEQEAKQHRQAKLRDALEHANNALHLYRSIGEKLQDAALTCHIAHIEQALGHTQVVQQRLRDLIDVWNAKLHETPTEDHMLRTAQANVVSSAACMLAEIALDRGDDTQASEYANLALQAAEESYIVRKFEAHTILGRILEFQKNKQAEQEFRAAAQVLSGTERIGSRISAHVRLGSYLYNIGEQQKGNQELQEARQLSESVLTGGDVTPKEELLV